MTNPDDALAGSYDFMHLFGHTALGLMWSRMAVAAQTALSAGEGDAAFLSRRADTLDGDATVAATTQAAVAMHRAFHIERQHVATNLCPCDGCVQANNLKLKFVAHVGDVATQTIKRRRKLVGIDVIGGEWLTEINVTSPTGIVAIERFDGTDVAGMI